MSDARKAIASIAAFLLMIGALGFVFFTVARDRDRVFDMLEYTKARQQYLFDGANKRGLLDICVNKAGKSGVWFKEECE